MTHVLERPTTPPSLLLQLGECLAGMEALAFTAASPWFSTLPRGDGQPVLVLPGFLGDDASTLALRAVLRTLGYPTYGWELGRNHGPTDTVLDGMEDRLVRIAERHGRTVSVVGWSLGGIYARELARDHPEAVRQVVTLGSPFRLRPEDRTTASAITDRLNHTWRKDALRMAMDEAEKPCLPVPSTAIYTRADGVVRWQLCIDEICDEHENIEVRATHIGLGFNPAVVLAVADRIAQREGEWRPFRRPLLWRGWFPRAATWNPRMERVLEAAEQQRDLVAA